MGNGNGKRGIRNSKNSATELAVTMKSQAYRLAVVSSLATFVVLLRGGSAVCDKNKW